MAKINFYDPENPMLEYEVGGYKYSFSVEKFPVECYDWLCECIQTDANRIHKLAYLSGQFDTQYKIKSALGL
jgi:hypothetical protein